MIINFKIYCLSENKTKNKLKFKTEHGLSYLIIADDKKILFDTGQSNIFLQNAEKMNLNLNDIHCVILSHSHYDHAGGLEYIKNKKIIIHNEFINPKYKLIEKKYKFIGAGKKIEFYKKNNELIQIKDNYNLSSDIKILCNFKKSLKTGYFYIKKNNDFIDDNFDDELILTFNTKKGLIIITGCAHSGIINIIEKSISENPSIQNFGLFGGFHLSKEDLKTNEYTADRVNKYKFKIIGISHCTGNQFEKFIDTETINFNSGDTFEL